MLNIEKVLASVIVIISTNFYCLYGQVTISPEVGISYMPYTLVNYNSKVKQNKIDLVLGISGSVPISTKLDIQTRIAFVLRHKARYVGSDMGINPKYKGYVYTNNGLDISFNVLYEIFSQSKVGIGGGINYDTKSEVIADYTDYYRREDIIRDKFLPFVNVSFQQHFDSIVLRFSYINLLAKEMVSTYSIHIREKIGSSELRLTIGYTLGNKK